MVPLYEGGYLNFERGKLQSGGITVLQEGEGVTVDVFRSEEGKLSYRDGSASFPRLWPQPCR